MHSHFAANFSSGSGVVSWSQLAGWGREKGEESEDSGESVCAPLIVQPKERRVLGDRAGS